MFQSWNCHICSWYWFDGSTFEIWSEGAGYFCKPTAVWKSVDGQLGLRERVLKRFRRLYLPFIAYGFILVLLKKPMLLLGIVTPDAYAPGGIPAMLLKMEPPTNLLGGFWFLRSLLIAAVGVDVVLFLLRKWKNAKLILLAALFCAVLLFRLFPPGTPMIRQLVLAAMGAYFFVLGMVFRDVEHRCFVHPSICLAGLVLFLLVAYFKPLSMNAKGVFDNLIYMLVAPIGIVLTVLLSRWIDRRDSALSKSLRYCGDQTLTILGLHFLAFKAVNLLAVAWYGLPKEQVAQFSWVGNLGGCWWVVYSVLGVVLPLAVVFASGKVKRFVHSTVG